MLSAGCPGKYLPICSPGSRQTAASSFPVISPDFYAEALVPALGAGELTGGGGMIRPKCLFKSGFEYHVAFRADVFNMIEVVAADYCSPGNSRQHPYDKGPPYAFDDP